MTPAKPSLDLLRSLSEEHVLRALMAEARMTRAEIATRTGISKPTISDTVRRLVDAGIVDDTGEQRPGRGRAGSYYTLSPGTGAALVVAVDPTGVTAETLDPFGTTVAQAHAPLTAVSGTSEAADALARAAAVVGDETPAPVRLAVVSAADPVDRSTGRLVHLPDAPFLVGDLDPRDVLAPYVSGEVVVDNDVNWAARAEVEHGHLPDPNNFFYLHLGEGLGCAVVCEGAVWQGHAGVAGEIAHLVTTGPDGSATRLTDVFGELDLRHAGSTAIDVDRVRAALYDPEARAVVQSLATALGGVLSAAVAMADPEVVVVGGAWGSDAAFIEALREASAALPRAVRVAPSRVGQHPELVGARSRGLEQLRRLIVDQALS